MKPLVSVIVPVYNVDNYLEKCLDSIVNQTYSNLEIILINDGSSDQSGTICDKYGELDSRIKVLHKHNEGQSVARNIALDICQGIFVCFIDSDDWICTETIETLVTDLMYYKADCVYMEANICNTKDEIISTAFHYFDNKIVIDKYEYLKLLLQEKVGSQPCLAISKTECWKDIRFPAFRVYEDIATMYLVSRNFNNGVIFTQHRYYNYRMNPTGTSLSRNLMKKQYDRYLSFKERYYFSRQFCSEQIDSCLHLAADCAIGVINCYYRDPIQNRNHEYIKEVTLFLRSNIYDILKIKQFSLRRKMLVILSLNLKVYALFFSLYLKIIGDLYD